MAKKMKVGDYVKVKKPRFISPDEGAREREGQLGIIVDCLEMADGFLEYEVLFENVVDWFCDLELELVSEV